jgi:tRNA A58 N-methylase Trm61
MSKNQNPVIFQRLKTGLEVSDNEFDVIYTERIKDVSAFHFTPVEVAKIAAQFLAEKPGAKVLDVGSGAGKFCMIGTNCTKGHFTGVEQRESLYLLSEKLSNHYRLPNLTFIHSNITDIGFAAFDAIYFFNAFHENISQSDPIDNSVILDRRLYDVYSLYVKAQLDTMPAGTRLATYFSYLDEVPDSYKILSTHFDDKLKLWKKTV